MEKTQKGKNIQYTKEQKLLHFAATDYIITVDKDLLTLGVYKGIKNNNTKSIY